MKKASLSVLAVILVSLLVSCITSDYRNGEFTEEQAQYAMHLAADTAVETAFDRMESILRTGSFYIPPAYYVLDENKATVPGLSSILNKFRSYITEYLAEKVPVAESQFTAWVNNLKFDNAKEYVKKSTTSASELFSYLYSDLVMEQVKLLLSDADFSLLEQARLQYNKWVEAQNFMNITEGKNYTIPLLEKTDCEYYFRKTFADTFLQLLSYSEDLYRTTPEAYKDGIAAYVFNVE